MRHGAWSMLGAVGVLLLTSGCVAIEAGHEGVMVEQPFFFATEALIRLPPRRAGSGLRRRRRLSKWMSGHYSIRNISTLFRLKTLRSPSMRL
jgi:hypothetical protein